jgi:hypothetical protein
VYSLLKMEVQFVLLRKHHLCILEFLLRIAWWRWGSRSPHCSANDIRRMWQLQPDATSGYRRRHYKHGIRQGKADHDNSQVNIIFSPSAGVHSILYLPFGLGLRLAHCYTVPSLYWCWFYHTTVMLQLIIQIQYITRNERQIQIHLGLQQVLFSLEPYIYSLI